MAAGVARKDGPTAQCREVVEVATEGRESIPKGEARVCKALGDGSCLFYCILGDNDPAKAMALRAQIGAFAASNAQRTLGDTSTTLEEELQRRGLTMEGYIGMLQQPCLGGEVELFLAAAMFGMQFKVFTDQGDHWGELVHYGTQGEVRRLIYSRGESAANSHYDILQPKERWVQEQELWTAEGKAADQKAQKTREGERTGPKQTNKERENRIQASVEHQRDQARERRKRLTQESRDRGHASSQGEPEGSEDTLALEVLLEEAHEGELLCVCRRPYNSKEYYIQCRTCLGWFHPRCLGLNQTTCEAERRGGGWHCVRVECTPAERPTAPTPDEQNAEEEGPREGEDQEGKKKEEEDSTWKPLDVSKGALAATRSGDMAEEVPPCLPTVQVHLEP
jgi:hypothetical protein